jgi:lysophospholipase L1-like esterase
MPAANHITSNRHGRALRAIGVVVRLRCRRGALGATAAAFLALTSIAFGPTVVAWNRQVDERWVGTWSASPQLDATPIEINGQTVREIVHTSIGGKRVRVRFSNAYGTSDLVIRSAHVAISSGGSSIAPGTDRILRFNGSPTITIPPGALTVSDPVVLDIRPFDDLAVSLYLPEHVVANTHHEVALQTTYLSTPGDFTGAISLTATTTQSYYFLTGIEVVDSKPARAVVALGDSVTDGFGSTAEANQRWTNLLALRLQSNPGTSRVAVLNAGVSGNRILHDFLGTGALARLDRDVLVQTGVKYVIVLEGNADFLIPGLIGNAAEVVTAAQVIQGHRQIIDRSHALGLMVYGGTLSPVEGYPFPGAWSPEMEEKRQAVNRWIRTGGAYDAVIDFDKVLRDPTSPTRMLPAYDSGDHTHPNDLGSQAMADAVHLSLFGDDDEN